VHVWFTIVYIPFCKVVLVEILGLVVSDILRLQPRPKVVEIQHLIEGIMLLETSCLRASSLIISTHDILLESFSFHSIWLSIASELEALTIIWHGLIHLNNMYNPAFQTPSTPTEPMLEPLGHTSTWPSGDYNKALLVFYSLFMGESSCHKPLIVLFDVICCMNHHLGSLRNGLVLPFCKPHLGGHGQGKNHNQVIIFWYIKDTNYKDKRLTKKSKEKIYDRKYLSLDQGRNCWGL